MSLLRQAKARGPVPRNPFHPHSTENDMKNDALRGVKHKVEEVLVEERRLAPFEHFCPPLVPNDLALKVYNMSPSKTYIIKVYEVAEFTTLPKRKR
jgi:hypothetical protein